MPEYIHGGTDPKEVARLEKQARFLAPMLLRRFEAHPGERVLDLATGVGAMAGELLARFPGIRLFGVDLRASQLLTARQRQPGVRYVQANAAELPFAEGSFDRVHCSWLLEHVREPVPILREVRRVLRPGGTVQFAEVDNATFSTTPSFPAVEDVMDALNRAQREAGGDPFVGQKLGALFAEAGFGEVEVFPNELVGTNENPTQLQGMVDEWAEIFEGLDEALGPQLRGAIERAAARLRGLPRTPGAEFRYCGRIAIASKR